MQVVFHLGAPCTDYDLLIKSLLKNRARLAYEGVAVPTPGRYRSVVRDTARALKGRAANAEVQEALIDAILDEPEIDRLVLSDPRFICINRLVVQGAQIWPMIGRQAGQLRALFPDAQVEFCVGMRNPATLIPALFRGSRFDDFDEFADGMQPRALAWSEMLTRLTQEHPDCPVTVWCNEDTPILWAELMRELAGVGPEVPLEGGEDLIETIMEPAGFTRMQRYFEENPPETEAQRRRSLVAFLERYAIEDRIEEELDLPGWTEDLVETLSEDYDVDMDAVAQVPGVRLLAP